MPEVQFKRDQDGRFICPHNNECRCTSTNCAPCGWNPAVFKRRVKALAKEFNTPADELAKILGDEEAM